MPRRRTVRFAVTGGAFVPNGLWPAPFDGAYLFADYMCGKIFRLVPATGGGYTPVPLVEGLGASSAVSMVFGPYQDTQALYYTTYADGGQVRRISHQDQANSAPTAVIRVPVKL